MNIIMLIEMGLMVAQRIVDEATENKLDDQIVASARAAVVELKKVHGQAVTQQGLEDLRTKPRW